MAAALAAVAAQEGKSGGKAKNPKDSLLKALFEGIQQFLAGTGNMKERPFTIGCLKGTFCIVVEG